MDYSNGPKNVKGRFRLHVVEWLRNVMSIRVIFNTSHVTQSIMSHLVKLAPNDCKTNNVDP